MKRRGTFTKAGPVTIRRPTFDGELEVLHQPAYSPAGYWQAVKAHQREAEERSLAAHTSKKATRRRQLLQAKRARGQAALDAVLGMPTLPSDRQTVKPSRKSAGVARPVPRD